MPDLAFTVPGPPHGKGRPRASLRGAHIRMYTDAKTVAYEDRVGLCAIQAMRDVLWGKPKAGPIDVVITAYRKRPKRPPKTHECRTGHRVFTVDTDGPRRLCTAKPDGDNIAKAVLDACNHAGVWRDDTQVASLSVLKVWAREGEAPRADVRITCYPPPEVTA